MQENARNLKADQTIAAILLHPTLIKAAQFLGINEATLWRRMQYSDLRRGLREAKKRIYQQALLRLQTIAIEAVDTLATIMKDPSEPGSTRVSAARTILEGASKAVECDELRNRIEGLEDLLR